MAELSSTTINPNSPKITEFDDFKSEKSEKKEVQFPWLNKMTSFVKGIFNFIKQSAMNFTVGAFLGFCLGGAVVLHETSKVPLFAKIDKGTEFYAWSLVALFAIVSGCASTYRGWTSNKPKLV